MSAAKPAADGPVPAIMFDPRYLPHGDHWAHTCPAKAEWCHPRGGVQGGQPGLAAHLAVVHPQWHGGLSCAPPCGLTLNV